MLLPPCFTVGIFSRQNIVHLKEKRYVIKFYIEPSLEQNKEPILSTPLGIKVLQSLWFKDCGSMLSLCWSVYLEGSIQNPITSCFTVSFRIHHFHGKEEPLSVEKPFKEPLSNSYSRMFLFFLRMTILFLLFNIKYSNQKLTTSIYFK